MAVQSEHDSQKTTVLNPVRILHITSFFYPHVGGSQRYMEELFFHTIADHPNVQVNVLCYNTDNAPEEEIYRGMTIYRIPCMQIIRGRFNLPNLVALIRILQKLKSNKYTHVHTHLRFFDTSWWTWFYAKKINAISMFTEHVATHPVHQWFFVTLISWLVDKTIAKWVLPKYDIVTTTNKAAADFLSNKIGIKKPIEIVYGGINTTLFSPLTSKKGIIPHTNNVRKESDIVITFIGRLIWTKGVTYLYEAIKQLHSTLPTSVKFIIVGSGELTEWLQKSIQQDGLHERISTTGSLTSEAVKSILQFSDIVVHPSHHNEGFPNVILEAGACGNYVIATDIGGTTEIIKNGVTGKIIPQKNSSAIISAITWAIEHTDKRENIAQELRRNIMKQFDWKQISNVYYEIISYAQSSQHSS